MEDIDPKLDETLTKMFDLTTSLSDLRQFLSSESLNTGKVLDNMRLHLNSLKCEVRTLDRLLWGLETLSGKR
jgi:hypothetical protein